MLTAKAFEAAPHFLENGLVYELPALTSSELIASDPERSRKFFEVFCAHGFPLLKIVEGSSENA